ncbi:MAG: winged helix-turn-helix domain-containing protein [Pseudomonadota bacterium]
MRHYRFEPFTFDSQRGALHRNRQRVALRPKAAQLLRTLLEAGGDVVPKGALVNAVWGTPHVADQSLFQTVSELRRALAPLDVIVTHPNRGYAWAGPLASASRRRWVQAASVAALIAGSLLLAPAPEVGNVAATDTAQPLPALHALSNGILSLREQRFADAERHFALALSAHPQLHEARLLLAETWLARGDTTRARTLAVALLDAASPDEAYLTVAAMDLLSRTSAADGTHDAALDWARSAADGARDSGFVCAVAELEDRIATLAGVPQPSEPTPRQSPVLARAAEAQPTYCQQIYREQPDTGRHDAASRSPAAVRCRQEALLTSMA